MTAYATIAGLVKSVSTRQTEGGKNYPVLALEIAPNTPLICIEVWSKDFNPSLYKDKSVVTSGECWLIDSKQPGVKKTLSVNASRVMECDPNAFLEVSVTGRLGRDPEIKFIESSGLAITSFSLAVKRFKDTSWFDFAAFKKSAETIANYVKKGQALGVIASFKWESWDKDGVKNHKLKGTVNSFELMGKDRDSEISATNAEIF